eukprot:COSAG03_NODE_11694_length_580_cov_0.958420_1_plen_129_part_01
MANAEKTECIEIGEGDLQDPDVVAEILATGTNQLVQTTMQMSVGEAVLVEGSEDRATFVAALRSELAASLGLSPDEIEITGLRPLAGGGRRRLQAGVPVQFDVVLKTADVGAALQELDRQLADPASALM